MFTRTPDFENNLLRILKGEKPQRATLFELILSNKFFQLLAGHPCPGSTPVDNLRWRVEAMKNAGYDYAVCHACDLHFRPVRRTTISTATLNGDSLIYDWESFEKFQWPDMDKLDYSKLEGIRPYLPQGMKILPMGPGGVLENVIDLVGYDNLCIMLYDEPDLAEAVFSEVGSRLVRYYENASAPDTVGLVCSNDDWGFNTQTFLSPALMRKYVFPWHKKIVETVHKYGKPCMLHSCGHYGEVIDDIVEDLRYDARHSYEDNIIPVEEAYESLNGRIAVLGGIDIHFLATKTPEEIAARSRRMLERTWDRGGYALGSGNSIPDYIPEENYLAMIRTVHEFGR